MATRGLDLLSAETLDIIRHAQMETGQPGLPSMALQKTINQATGLIWYDLERPSKSLFPVLTPLRNRIPRVKGRGGTAVHWKAITGINITAVPIWVPEGGRNNRVTTQEVDRLASYKGLGLEDAVTFEAQYGAVNFEDVRALAARNLLWATMIREELAILGGNTSVSLGAPSAPTVTAVSTGGSIGAVTPTVYVVALTLEGINNLGTTGPIGQYQITDPATLQATTANGGASPVSAGTSPGLLAGTTNLLNCSVPIVNGALAYAWFVSTAGTLATAFFAAVSYINSIVIKSLPAATNVPASTFSADFSANALAYDGLLYYAFNPALGAYISTQATGTVGTGTPLTSDSAGGIVEIDTMLKSFWDNLRLGPQVILVNSQEALNINKKVIAGGAAPLFRFVTEGGDAGVTAATRVRNYLNKFTGEEIPLDVHPNMPPGTLFAVTERLPYPNTNVPIPIVVETRQEYYQLEWPLRTRLYETGVYADEVLIAYFPAGFGIISNIANG